MFKVKDCAGTIPAILGMACAMAASNAYAQSPTPLLITATNGAQNSLAVINAATKQTVLVPTGGAGGAGGNAGGVAVDGSIAAVVNFGSSNVTIFSREGDAMVPSQLFATASKPVSVAFVLGHLGVLGQSTLQSFRTNGVKVEPQSDGIVPLMIGDGSAAQVVVYNGGAMYTEKTGDIVGVPLGPNGVAGANTSVALPQAPNNNTPFGLVGRGNEVYATIAHSNLEALITNGEIVSLAENTLPSVNANGGFLHAPCWNTLFGQFLFTSDSPGQRLSRYLVSDTNIFFDKPQVATLNGAPTDLTVVNSLLAVIDGGSNGISNITLFELTSEGELNQAFSLQIAGAINGVGIVL